MVASSVNRHDPSTPVTVSGIFISYRRADSQGFAGRLGDDLEDRFGAEHVFRDVEIEPGVDFAARINGAIARCDVLLAVIGPHWLSASGNDGKSRLWEGGDWVRLEIEAGLKRRIPVLPVLVGSARLPEVSDLPAPLKGLSQVQALPMSDRGWDADLERLCGFIEKRTRLRRRTPTPAATQQGRLRRWRVAGRYALRLAKKAAVLALAAALAYFVLEHYADPSVKQFIYRFAEFLVQTVETFLFG